MPKRYRLRATGYAGTFKTQKAIDDLNKAISLNPDDHESYFTLGIVHLRDEKYQDAVEELTKAIEHYKPKEGQEDVPYVQGYLTSPRPTSSSARTLKTTKPLARPRTKQPPTTATSCYKQLDKRTRNMLQARAAALFSRGVAERMLGDYGAAIRTFSQAIELNPELGDAYFRRGICFHMLNENKMAISDFEQAAHISYDDPRAELWAGFTYAKLGDYHKALRAYGDAIAASDRYTPAYANRGLAYWALGEYDKAIADFNEAIRLDPTKAEYYYKRGLAYEKLKDYKKASESSPRRSSSTRNTPPPTATWPP